jgi:hypothetical protein
MKTIAVCPHCGAWILLQAANSKGKALYFFCPVCAERVEASSFWAAPTPKAPEVHEWIPIRLEVIAREIKP